MGRRKVYIQFPDQIGGGSPGVYVSASVLPREKWKLTDTRGDGGKRTGKC